MVGLLDLAARHACESALAERLAVILGARELPGLAALKAEFAPKASPVTDVSIPPPETGIF